MCHAVQKIGGLEVLGTVTGVQGGVRAERQLADLEEGTAGGIDQHRRRRLHGSIVLGDQLGSEGGDLRQEEVPFILVAGEGQYVGQGEATDPQQVGVRRTIGLGAQSGIGGRSPRVRGHRRMLARGHVDGDPRGRREPA